METDDSLKFLTNISLNVVKLNKKMIKTCLDLEKLEFSLFPISFKKRQLSWQAH